MLGLNGIIIDWSLPSKLKSIWINQLLNRKSLGSGQEANLRPCTLAGLYFALFLQTRWEIFSFLFLLFHTQKKTAFYWDRLWDTSVKMTLQRTPARLCSILVELPRSSDTFWEPCAGGWASQLPERFSQHWDIPWWRSRFVPAVMWAALSCRPSKAHTQRASSAVRRGWKIKQCKACSCSVLGLCVCLTPSVQALGNQVKQVRNVVGQCELKIVMAHSK